MKNTPFEISFIAEGQNAQPQIIICKNLLRSISGNRQVYDAEWNGQKVIAKIFSRGLRSQIRARKDWNGYYAIYIRGLPSPKPLAYGQTGDKRKIIITEKIDNSKTAIDVFRQLTDDGKVLFLEKAALSLAEMHIKGVIQKDLHLGNFLVRDGMLYAIDPAKMKFSGEPIGELTSVRQLAVLCTNCPANVESAQKIVDAYFQRRNWKCDNRKTELLYKLIIKFRKKGIRRALKKSLRSNRRHFIINTKTARAVFARHFCDKNSAENFIANIDKLMEGGVILKRGNTSFVSRIKFEGKEIVIKRYNNKGLLHSLRHTLKGSRAKKCWLNAQFLLALEIATPLPLAFIEKRQFSLIQQSYFVTEFTVGQQLYDFLRNPQLDDKEKNRVATQMQKILAVFNNYKITHGDLKHSNILVTENGIALTDLDSMTVHKAGLIHSKKSHKDRERLEATIRTNSRDTENKNLII